MIQFKISAPGKVILCGEHAVVYGKTAIAAALDLRTTSEFAELELPESKQIIKISFPKVDLSLNISVQEVQDFFFSNNTDYYKNYDLLYKQVQEFVSTLKCSTLQQKLSMEAFFYLLIYIAYEEKIDLKSFHMHLNTQLSIGSGLGSSASFAVCLAASFLYWSRLQKNIRLIYFDTFELEKISKYALNCEKIMHGNPSGIDNSVCTYGSIIEFRKGEPVNPVPGIPNMKILLVDTRVGRSTKVLVQRLAELKCKYPTIIDPILDSIDNVSKETLQVLNKIRELLTSGGTSLMEEYQQLMTLININQGLLSTVQVSHPSLDRICAEAQKHSLAAKLTGAGGGGYAYILLLPDTISETISVISQKLNADGFSVTLTSLGCDGVKIH